MKLNKVVSRGSKEGLGCKFSFAYLEGFAPPLYFSHNEAGVGCLGFQAFVSGLVLKKLFYFYDFRQ